MTETEHIDESEPTPPCTCHRSAVEPCPTHGALRDHATSLRLRLDTDRNDPARAALYAALWKFERAQRNPTATAEGSAD